MYDGLCVPSDDRIESESFTCFCKEGYFGSRCEYVSNRIVLSLDKTIMSASSFIFVHFVTAFEDEEHHRTTKWKKMPIDDDDLITIYVSQPFNILFAQLSNLNYYLIILRETFIPAENIGGQVLPQQRCSNVTDLLNSTILDMIPIERAKFYPLLCRENVRLMCLYDEIVMCICDLDRFANCFVFNHSVNNDCQGNNDCENEGQCFQNSQICPTTSICVCKECFYGDKCQLSTKSYIISLDPIFAYHIKPNGAMTILLFIVGLINGLLSIMTFRMPKVKEVGCGYYLLTSSIISILMIFVLTIKFCHLVLSQMEIIQNRSLLLFNCRTLDILLNVLLVSNEWLITCVAIERLINATHGVTFNKRKSKKIVNWIIPVIILVIILSHIHNPIYRELIDDLDGGRQRVWRFVRYPPAFDIYNSSLTLINFISTFFIVKFVTRNRSNVASGISFRQELYQHKHLSFPPGIVILLGTPRMIITFISGCMRSARNPWLYLFGYFISFIPSILIFLIFVIPSEHYKEQLRASIQRQLKRFRSS